MLRGQQLPVVILASIPSFITFVAAFVLTFLLLALPPRFLRHSLALRDSFLV